MTDRDRAIIMGLAGVICIVASVGLLFGLASLAVGFGCLVIGTGLLSAAVWTI